MALRFGLCESRFLPKSYTLLYMFCVHLEWFPLYIGFLYSFWNMFVAQRNMLVIYIDQFIVCIAKLSEIISVPCFMRTQIIGIRVSASLLSMENSNSLLLALSTMLIVHTFKPMWWLPRWYLHGRLNKLPFISMLSPLDSPIHCLKRSRMKLAHSRLFCFLFFFSFL